MAKLIHLWNAHLLIASLVSIFSFLQQPSFFFFLQGYVLLCLAMQPAWNGHHFRPQRWILTGLSQQVCTIPWVRVFQDGQLDKFRPLRGEKFFSLGAPRKELPFPFVRGGKELLLCWCCWRSEIWNNCYCEGS